MSEHRLYEEYLAHPGWQHMRPLQRVLLGRRKELRLSLAEVGEAIGAKAGMTAERAARAVQIVEEGGLIRRKLFRHLVEYLALDVDEIERLIEEQRREDIRQNEGWKFRARAFEVTLCVTRSAGVTRPVPDHITTPESASQYASDLAKEKGFTIILDIQRRLRLRFDRTGQLVEFRLLPALWSAYPFGGMVDRPPTNDEEFGDPSPERLRQAVRQLGEALARARRMGEVHRNLPSWFAVLPPDLAKLFRDAEFWGELKAPDLLESGLGDREGELR
jgi:hypothetical protein